MRTKNRVVLGLVGAFAGALFAVGLLAGSAAAQTGSVPNAGGATNVGHLSHPGPANPLRRVDEAQVAGARRATIVPAGGDAQVGPAGLAGMVAPTPAPGPGATAPPGPDLNQGQQAADKALGQRRLVLGLVCAVLVVIVYFGHRARYKHRIKLKNLQNAKG